MSWCPASLRAATRAPVMVPFCERHDLVPAAQAQDWTKVGQDAYQCAAKCSDQADQATIVKIELQAVKISEIENFAKRECIPQ